EANNYYWGYWRNELNWGIATYGENPDAPNVLAFALTTRWLHGVIPFFAGPGDSGVPGEGSQYGRYALQYPVIPLTSAGLLGRDLLDETNWYRQAALYLIYSTSPDGSLVFPFDDDEKSYGAPPAQDGDYADFMSMIVDHDRSSPIGQYAQRWMNFVHADSV